MLKIVIPAATKAEIRDELRLAEIDAQSVCPDLTGLAAAVAYWQLTEEIGIGL